MTTRWRPDGDARHCHAAKDAASGPVRDHTGNAERLAGVDQASQPEVRGLPVSQPAARITLLGTRAQDKGNADLAAHQES